MREARANVNELPHTPGGNKAPMGKEGAVGLGLHKTRPDASHRPSDSLTAQWLAALWARSVLGQPQPPDRAVSAVTATSVLLAPEPVLMALSHCCVCNE